MEWNKNHWFQLNNRLELILNKNISVNNKQKSWFNQKVEYRAPKWFIETKQILWSESVSLYINMYFFSTLVCCCRFSCPILSIIMDDFDPFLLARLCLLFSIALSLLFVISQVFCTNFSVAHLLFVSIWCVCVRYCLVNNAFFNYSE